MKTPSEREREEESLAEDEEDAVNHEEEEEYERDPATGFKPVTAYGAGILEALRHARRNEYAMRRCQVIQDGFSANVPASVRSTETEGSQEAEIEGTAPYIVAGSADYSSAANSADGSCALRSSKFSCSDLEEGEFLEGGYGANEERGKIEESCDYSREEGGQPWAQSSSPGVDEEEEGEGEPLRPVREHGEEKELWECLDEANKELGHASASQGDPWEEAMGGSGDDWMEEIRGMMAHLLACERSEQISSQY